MQGGFLTEAIGTLAAICTTIAFIPQALLVLKRRETRDISLAMYIVFNTGLALWLAYGVAIASWPIIIANIITLCLALAILGAKLRYG